MKSLLNALALLLLWMAPASAPADNATARVRQHVAKMSFLDNGSIKLGVDLHAGGAITWLSKSGSDQNLVNGYDFGRQIQMSYYAGPVPFIVDGKHPKPEWEKIGWNPIQVGDAFGNPSKVVESSNDGKEIHVQCIPMHWPLENVPGECTYDCWLTLEGSAVHARCRLVNHRPDHTQYPARRQELPAIYTNGPWYKLMSYVGDHPFAHEPPTRILKQKNEPGMWSSWLGTESWAALVDDNDFGLGIYIPNIIEFGGGFAGKPGAGGPTNNPTGYIAPHPLEIIDWNIQHEYHYHLVLGKLSDIRKYVYDHAAKPAPPQFVFATDRQGWTYHNATDSGWPLQGELNVQLDHHNPMIISPVRFWQASDSSTLVIEAAAQLQGGGRIYWRNWKNKDFSAAQSLPLSLIKDGAFHACRIDLSQSPLWTGAIVQIRIDPVSEGAGGDWIRIKSIRFEQ